MEWYAQSFFFFFFFLSNHGEWLWEENWNGGHSALGNKNENPEFSRISGGGSISEISICCIVLEMSSTVNGILQYENQNHVHKVSFLLESRQWISNGLVKVSCGLEVNTLSRRPIRMNCLQHCSNPRSSLFSYLK